MASGFAGTVGVVAAVYCLYMSVTEWKKNNEKEGTEN